MARPSSKPIEYTIATEIEKVCPKCFEKPDYPGASMTCQCGWDGKRSELLTKLTEFKVKAYKSVSFT